MRTLIAASLFLVSSPLFAAETFVPAVPAIAAKAYILMDAGSGQILAERNADKRLPPASLTKIMTSYIIDAELAAGNIAVDDVVSVSEKAWAKNFPGSSKMFIEPGRRVTVGQLRKGIIVQSGNDASVAMAEDIAGGEDAFAELMNHYTKQLGMKGSHFVNSTGLPSPNHYSTAHDMAILARASIVDYPQGYKLYRIKKYKYNNIEQLNRNALLWDKNLHVDGLKTGHTKEAGYGLVSSAVKDNMRLIAVVMGTKSGRARVEESKKLLNWGFRFYRTVAPVVPGKALHRVRVWYGARAQLAVGINHAVAVTVPRGQVKNLRAEYVSANVLEAPVRKGQMVGTLFFRLNGKDIRRVPLVALEDLPEGGMFSRFGDWISRKFDSWF